MNPRTLVLLATLFTPAAAVAGDGTFGVPPSGILPPPTQTASLNEDDMVRTRARDTTGSIVSKQYPRRTPAPNAGNSRPSAQDDEPAARPAPKPRKKPQARKPVPSVDPAYLARAQADGQGVAPYAPQPMPAVQAPPRRGLFTSGVTRQTASYPAPAAAAAHQEYTAAPQSLAPQHYPQPQAVQPQHYAQQQPATSVSQQQTAGRVKMSRSGVPCQDLRGIFTSPPECR